jgi:hypothetical protein
MSANAYANKIVEKFIEDITDHVFLSIERDENLMREYMTNVNRYGLDTVNMAIGKEVAKLLNLENTDENKKPKSQLIKIYTRHKRK